MKKLLWRAALATGTVGAIIAGAAAFSAFEAHVVNVTATIENALTVPQELGGVDFGTIFPEEVAHKALTVSLSDSFLREERVEDVEYFIRQKPKCVDNQDSSLHPQVTEDGITFHCPEGSTMMPLLCPYLSKHLLDGNCDPNAKEGEQNACYGIDAFHGDINNWTELTSEATQVGGHLTKVGEHLTDNWDIDLHAPCFKGQCAQDNVIPASFQPDPKLNGQTFGCDLWVEVNGISLNGTTTTLTVIKHVDNSSGTKSNVAGDFTMNVSGTNVSNASFAGAENPGVTVTLDPGAYSVTETSNLGYNDTYSTDCSGNISAGQHLTCTVTNTAPTPTPTATGTITVIKVVDNNDVGNKSAEDFQMTIDSNNVNQNEAVVVSASTHNVSETDTMGYVKTYSGDCDSNGDVIVGEGENKTCTVTNRAPAFTVTVNKTVVNQPGNGNNVVSDFSLFVGATSMTSGVSKKFAPGSYLVSESGVGGYVAGFAGDCDSDTQQLTGADGEVKTCTITNTVIFPNITLVKVVDSGPALPTDFIMRIDGGAPVPTGGSKQVTANTAHAITEDAKAGYHFVNITGSAKCPAVLGGTATLDEGEAITCTIHNAIDPS